MSLRAHLAFNPRPRRLSTSTDAFELHPDVRSYGTTLSVRERYTSALDAFYAMYRHNVSALAIVDDTNAIVANVSVSDLRGIKPDDVDQLASPVVDYLRRRRREVRPIPWFPYDRVGVVNAVS